MTLEIRDVTPEDMVHIRKIAEEQFRMILRPHAEGPRWRKAVEYGSPIYRDLSLGNMTQYKVGAFWTHIGRLFVAIENKGAYTFENWVHWTYAAEKLSLKESDARAMADWINTQTGCIEHEQGLYNYPNLFAENDKYD